MFKMGENNTMFTLGPFINIFNNSFPDEQLKISYCSIHGFKTLGIGRKACKVHLKGPCFLSLLFSVQRNVELCVQNKDWKLYSGAFTTKIGTSPHGDL